jgi:hypothetical protein
MLAIAQSTIPLTKSVRRLSKSSSCRPTKPVGRLSKSSSHRPVSNRLPITPRLCPPKASKTPSPLTNDVGQVANLSRLLSSLRPDSPRAPAGPAPAERLIGHYSISPHSPHAPAGPAPAVRMIGHYSHMQQFIPSPIPCNKNSTSKNPFFPKKTQQPPSSRYLICDKNPFHQTERQIAARRKTPHQFALAPRKCSTIHPQQFARGPVITGTSRPHIGQKFSPKRNKN